MGERGRRMAWWTGIGMVLVGLVLLGYVGWEFLGTNYVSHRHQSQARAQVRQAWSSGQPVAHTSWGDVGALIEIPRFGSSYEVPVFEGTSDTVLAAGYGHFTGTAGPGEVGNYALAAHRVTHGEPLRDMPDLQPGDEVDVVSESTTYVYRLTSGGDDLVVPFTATWVTSSLPTNPEPGGVQPPQGAGERLITLTTCSELFHTDNRMVAFGVLESTHPTT